MLADATVLDPAGQRRADVVIDADGRVAAVGPGAGVPAGARVLDCDGLVVTPGLVDLHTHLRQPGAEEAETIVTGAQAAVAGGYTCVLAMPNTQPTIDDPSVVTEVRSLAVDAACDVEVSAAMTIGRAGERLSPMAELARMGVRWFTDDGTGLQDDHLMRRALEYAAPLGVTLAQHAENAALAAGGVMHEGAVSSRLGLAGQPAEAEELMVMRDLALTRLTGGRLHVMHVSTAGSVAMIRAAKAGGLAVTAEVTPHHLSLTDAECASFDATYKVHPPLRTAADVTACREGLADGTLDCVATDHAPHTADAKQRPFDEAPPGMLGLETALGVALAQLGLPLATVLDRMSWTPARLLGLADHGRVEVGRTANLIAIDPEEAWTVDRHATRSRSHNTPFDGHQVRGRVRHTVARGRLAVCDTELVAS